jgi:putative Mg2+ transporter-C (MgtC) family protein
MDETVQLTLLGRAALAALLGFVIGLEREYRGKSAGDRTFALLAFGSASIVAVGAELLGPDGTSRVIQGVVTGVGFIGGGLIFRGEGGGSVRGLTTAAGAWAATGIGVITGVGAYLAAALAAALVIVILELDTLPLFRRIREQTAAAAGNDDLPG